MDLDAAANTFSLKAYFALISPIWDNAPVDSPVTFDSSVTRRLSGSLLVVNGDLAACPVANDHAGWLAAAGGFHISTGPGQPLSTSPQKHIGRTELAGKPATPVNDVDIADLSLSLSSTDIDASYSYDFEAGGDTWDYSFGITGRRKDSIVGIRGGARVAPILLSFQTSGNGRTLLVLEVPVLELVYGVISPTKLDLYGMGYGAQASFTIATRLVAKRFETAPPVPPYPPEQQIALPPSRVPPLPSPSPKPSPKPSPSAKPSPSPSPAPSQTDAGSNGLFRLSIALEGVDPSALYDDAAGQEAVAAAVAASAAAGGGGGSALLTVKVLSVSALNSADGDAVVLAMRVSAAQGAQPSPAAAQSAFDSLQSATLSLGLQRALRGGRSGLLAKARVRAISGQIRTQQQTVAQRRRLRAT
ncbi:hypothetical protein GPECTOR_29g98 [Gonium pectorale]|uniref:Uncharacterized protein n=1 Tax=Gonium pectorale TaxID=33097 RepID=A0A150GES2_GONPE|nr:hypothetical protein GPECTOR_29g98 [Gonium pectorale]|eukprot:KXZ48324.1 hypothetical protein GPECTOR_29g98 [Gonium pectorale]